MFVDFIEQYKRVTNNEKQTLLTANNIITIFAQFI